MQTHILEAWGDLACFTRPEMKVERYSYPIITPSAARGIFDAIYYKPAYGFYWQVERIELLTPPAYIALRRNEVKDKAPSEKTILQWMRGDKAPEPIFADGNSDSLGTDQKGRTQRQTMALKDVRYRLYAHLHFRSGSQGDAKALDAQFRRRAARGQCVWQPYLGCREFPAFFELIEPAQPRPVPQPLNLDLGWMLYDVFDLGRANDAHAKPAISTFRAHVKQGVLEVPPYESDAVRKLGR